MTAQVSTSCTWSATQSPLDPPATKAIQDHDLNALTCIGAVRAGHVPVAAFTAALSLLADEAFVAYTLDSASSDRDVAVLVRLIGELERDGRLRELARRRYRHRLTTTGEARMWEVVVARWSATGGA